MQEHASSVDYGFDPGLAFTFRSGFHPPDRLIQKPIARRFSRAVTDERADLGNR
jgi:hypothetical protein